MDFRGGGGVEKGESREKAAVRGGTRGNKFKIKIVRFLFSGGKYPAGGIEYCYLAEPPLNGGEQRIKLGRDPELGAGEQVLKRAEWVPIVNLHDDLHVSQVLRSLSREEIVKYKIYL